MEFEHVNHGDGGGGKGSHALALFKKKPAIMIGGLVAVVILAIFANRSKTASQAEVTSAPASGLDAYPTAGMSGSGGATGISAEQVDQIKSSISSGLTTDFNSQFSSVGSALSDSLKADVGQYKSDTSGTLQDLQNKWQEGYSADLVKSQEATKTVADSISSVTTAVNHLTTTVTAQNTKIADVAKQVTASKPSTSTPKAVNLTSFLKGNGMLTDKDSVKAVADNLGIKKYTGTSAQNKTMIAKLKANGVGK